MALQSLLGGTGVVSGMNVVHVASNLEVQVEPGELFIPGTYGTEAAARANAGSQHATYSTMKANFTTQGAYHSWLAAAYKLSVASNSSGKERIDLVVAKVEDGEYAGALNQAVLAIVTGTPEASPKAPTPPEACVVLVQYKVPSGATEILSGNITQEAPNAAMGLIAKNQYSAEKEFKSKEEIEPSSLRPSFISIVFELKESETQLVIVGGTTIASWHVPISGPKLQFSYGFSCPPGVKWKSEGANGHYFTLLQ